MKMPKNLVLSIATLCCLVFLGCTKKKPVHHVSDALEFSPVSIDQDDPLLFFKLSYNVGHQGTSSGRALYLCDPEQGKGLQLLCSSARSLSPVARVKSDLMLMNYLRSGFLLQLSSAEVTPLLPGKQETEVIAVEGDWIYFLGRKERDPRLVNPRDYDHLYAMDVSGGEGSCLLSSNPVEKVISVEDQAIWVITPNESRVEEGELWALAGTDQRKLCKILKSGEIEEVHAVDEHWIGSSICGSFSPSGNYLALSAEHSERDQCLERDLVVIDLEERYICYSRERISILDLSPGSGSGLSDLLTSWEGDAKLKYSHSAGVAEVDILSGTAQSGSGLASGDQSSVSNIRISDGLFDLHNGAFYFKGEESPLIDVARADHVAIDSKGCWAVGCNQSAHVFLFDGQKKSESWLTEGRVDNFLWFYTGEARLESRDWL